MAISKIIQASALAALLFCALSCKDKGPREFYADDTTVVNIGTVKEEDGPYDFVILYLNSTSDTLIATDTRSSCRCTSPKVTNLPVPPGEYQRIPVSFNPHYMKGAVDEQVDIRYRDGVIRSFPFIGNVIPMKHPVTDHARYHLGSDFYSSYKTLSFGLLAPGESREVYFNIGNDTPKKMSVRFDLDGKCADEFHMRRALTMVRDGRDSVHVKFTMPEGLARNEEITVALQPVVNGVPTEEHITLRAKVK